MLRTCDPQLVNRRRSVIETLKNLDVAFRRILADRIAVDAMSADQLWTELNRWCDDHDDFTALELDEHQHALALVSAMARRPEEFGARVLQRLSDPDNCGSWLEIYLIRLAGEMRLERASPFLADRLDDPETYACNEAIIALERIGTDAVVREFSARYAAGDLDLRFSAAAILGRVHTDLSVQTCLEWFAQETDDRQRHILIESVLANFSALGIEPARQFILNSPKAAPLLDLRRSLLIACAACRATFPELESWREDFQRKLELRSQWFQNLFEVLHGPPIDRSDEEPDDRQALPPPKTIHRESRVGRNDPCPCGSGKKYKKCCYGNASLIGEAEPAHSETGAGIVTGPSARQFPLGTVAMYGPDDQTTTKIVAGVIKRENAEPILERWAGTNMENDPKVRRMIAAFFDRHRVKSVVAGNRNMGCPHEEGVDFRVGEDCPFCTFWAGKQGTSRHNA